MKTVTMHEAMTHLSRIVDEASQGESFLICKADKPMAMLCPIKEPQRPRKPGSLKGKIWIAEDFDEIDEEIADLFEGKPF